jgi:diguanylate cyclase (GGDEF)-like protein/PAS domain S-box-containing protein
VPAQPFPNLSLDAVTRTLSGRTVTDAYAEAHLASLSQRKLDAFALPLAYVDRHRRVRFANRALLEWSGRPQDEIVGRALGDVLGRDNDHFCRSYVDAALRGEPGSFERELAAPGRAAGWVRADFHPDRGIRGEVRGFLVALADIGRVKARELEAGRREARLRLVVDRIGSPVVYFDRQLRLRLINASFADWIGKPAGELSGRAAHDVLAADSFAELRGYLERAFAGASVSFERRDRKASGETRWVRMSMFPDREPGGRVTGAFAVITDIDGDVRLREGLRAQETQLRLFADNIGGPLAYLDRNLRFTFVNQAFANLACRAQSELCGHTPAEALPDFTAAFLQPFLDRARRGEPVEYERLGADAEGKPRWMHGRIVPDLDAAGGVRGYLCTEYDIHDVKLAEEALAERESQLRAIMDGVPAPVAYIGQDKRCRYVNRTLLDYFGLTTEQASAMALREVVGDAIYESAQGKIERAFGGEAIAFDRLVPGARGVRRWMTIRIVPDITRGGEVHGAFVLMNDIHGLKQAQEALRASEAELRRIMDNVPARVAYIDREYRYRVVNHRVEQWLGRTQDELARHAVVDVVGELRFASLKPLFARVLAGETVTTEQLLIQPHGDERWESIHYAPNLDAEGNVIGIYAVHTDIHEAKRNAEALRRANWMLSSHINNTPLAVLEWDRDFRLVRWSPQAENIFGWPADAVLGMPIDGNPLLHDAERQAVAAMLARLTAGDAPRATGLTRNYRQDGQTIWCEWYHSALHDDRGNIVSILSFAQDVSSRIQAEERLQYMATRDALTGLPNRVLLNDRLAQAIAQAKRNNRRVGVLFIDLDRFKNVNDTLGHRIGDELLKHVTQALVGAMRGSDLLARLGGDEFMVIVEDFDDPAVLGLIAQKLQDALARSFRIEGHEIYASASIGISIYPDDSENAEELLKYADVAMYRSKELGRGTYQFLDADLAQRRMRQHSLETALRTALKDDRLRLHYQPIVRLADRSVRGVEALLRWNDPEHGSVPPQVFIPLAEESGLIHALGEWVLQSAARQCVAWHAAGLPLRVSVNLSARQFHREDFAQRVLTVVRDTGCEPSWIELEVTETSLLHDLVGIRKVFDQLRAEGFTVAMDDFGTGYSPLTHLKHLPIDTLKIDISFIADLERDPGDAAITEAVIGLARGLGLEVVAEGVGTRAQLEFLDQRGCHCIQGFFVAEPLAADQVERFFRTTLRLR